MITRRIRAFAVGVARGGDGVGFLVLTGAAGVGDGGDLTDCVAGQGVS